MKTYFLLLASFFVLSLTNVNAQCTFQNPGIKLNSSQTQVGGGCLINIDLSFELSHNNGNKWVNIHIWPTASYPDLTYKKAPKSADLADAAANIIIDQRAIPTVAISNTYLPDGTVPVQYSGVTITRIEGVTYDRYTITNVSLLVASGCSIAQSFTGDVWSSQADPDNVVHCVSKGFTFIANDPKVVGSILCQNPRKYSVIITTVTGGVSGTYNVYRDNGDGMLDPLIDAIVATDVPWSATSTTPYQSGPQLYAGNNSNPTALQALFVVASTVGLSNTTIAKLENGCGILPVILSDFNSLRKNNNVVLNWKTASETNVDHFEIEKKIGTQFVTIGFVKAINASNGNAYTYTDANSSTGVTEYRIKTVDNGGAVRYSDIRTVKGFGVAADFSVYPNPSNGATKIIVSDITSSTNINISDISGRTIKTYSNLTGNQLDIKGLQKGVYFIRLTEQNSIGVVTRKIVIN
ncbi:MAG: T9SS type A sorting domain-containing protein [Bacteroidota bacterium]